MLFTLAQFGLYGKLLSDSTGLDLSYLTGSQSGSATNAAGHTVSSNGDIKADLKNRRNLLEKEKENQSTTTRFLNDSGTYLKKLYTNNDYNLKSVVDTVDSSFHNLWVNTNKSLVKLQKKLLKENLLKPSKNQDNRKLETKSGDKVTSKGNTNHTEASDTGYFTAYKNILGNLFSNNFNILTDEHSKSNPKFHRKLETETNIESFEDVYKLYNTITSHIGEEILGSSSTHSKALRSLISKIETPAEVTELKKNQNDVHRLLKEVNHSIKKSQKLDSSSHNNSKDLKQKSNADKTVTVRNLSQWKANKDLTQENKDKLSKIEQLIQDGKTIKDRLDNIINQYNDIHALNNNATPNSESSHNHPHRNLLATAQRNTLYIVFSIMIAIPVLGYIYLFACRKSAEEKRRLAAERIKRETMAKVSHREQVQAMEDMKMMQGGPGGGQIQGQIQDARSTTQQNSINNNNNNDFNIEMGNMNNYNPNPNMAINVIPASGGPQDININIGQGGDESEDGGSDDNEEGNEGNDGQAKKGLKPSGKKGGKKKKTGLGINKKSKLANQRESSANMNQNNEMDDTSEGVTANSTMAHLGQKSPRTSTAGGKKKKKAGGGKKTQGGPGGDADDGNFGTGSATTLRQSLAREEPGGGGSFESG